jgi:hypothetical protein
VLVENDANLAAWGERWRGVAAGIDDLVVMVADERLGSGLFLGGRPIRGHAGGAGELRFLELIERVGSTYGIAYLVRTMGAEAVAELGPREPAGGRGRRLWALAGGDPARAQTATVLEAARGGDEVALEIVDRVADRMAHAVASLAGMLDPELVVISGAVADDGDLFLDRIRRRLVPELIDSPPRVAMSTLGDQAVVVGAVRMALDHVEASLFGSPGAAPLTEAPALATAPPRADRPASAAGWRVGEHRLDLDLGTVGPVQGGAREALDAVAAPMPASDERPGTCGVTSSATKPEPVAQPPRCTAARYRRMTSTGPCPILYPAIAP